MDEVTARRLSSLTSQFYEQVSWSFSQTRQAPWQGWERVVDVVEAAGDVAPCSLLDLACGNLRFERYLATRLGRRTAVRRDDDRPLAVAYVLDSCDELALDAAAGIEGVQVRYRHLDVAEALFSGCDLGACLEARDLDLAVCFGFMHHLALPEHRERVMQALVGSVRSGGLVVVSLWQLSRSGRLLDKAREASRRAHEQLGIDGLGPGDYLLGWQDRQDVWRYCHDFAEDEVDGLAAAVAPNAVEVDRFSADGATGDLNRYLVLQVR